MSEHLGDRKLPRLDENTIIVLENTASGDQQSAILHNFSGDGLNCESDIPYRSGTEVIVRIKNWPNNSSNKCYSGEVRWCNKKLSAGTNSYDIGIQIKSIVAE